MNMILDRDALSAHWKDYEVTVLTHADPDYDYLREGEYALRIHNPLGMNDLEIEAAEEVSLFFAGKQKRYAADEKGLEQVTADADAIIAGKTVAVIFEINGDWAGSAFMPAPEQENPAAEDILSQFNLSEAFMSKIKNGDSTAHVVHWDAAKSRDVRLA